MNDDDLEAELDSWLETEVPVGEPTDDGDEVIEPAPDADFADRLAYKVARLRDDQDDVTALADRRRADIDAWEADRLGGIAREIQRCERSLEAFMRRWHRENPKRGKTLSLPSGALKLTKGRGKVIVTDEFAFTKWAEELAPDLVRYEPKPAKDALKDEQRVKRHAGPQQNFPDEVGLFDTWRLMVHVDEDPLSGRPAGDVSVPGVVFAMPVEDRFKLVPPKTDDTDDQEEA